MALVITKDAVRPMPQVNRVNTQTDILLYAVANSEIGKMLVARSAKGVSCILLGDIAGDLVTDLANRFPQSTIRWNAAAVNDDIAKVLRYIEKPSDGLYLRLDMSGTAFQRRVWEKLKAISVGRTASYRELAQWISPLVNPCAVARACAANPIALAIPCHRVGRSDGDLAAFPWGIERKNFLLQKEIMA